MKNLMIMLLGLVLSLTTLSSCCTTSAAVVSSVEVTDDIYTGGIDYTIVITHGTPFYLDGVISYYFYNGIYYYPYFYNGVRCLHPYRYCQPRGYMHVPPRGYRPDRRWIHRDDRTRFHHQPNGWNHRPNAQPNRGTNPRPNGGFHNGNNGRPQGQGQPNRSGANMRSSTRVTVGHGNSGTMHRGGGRR